MKTPVPSLLVVDDEPAIRTALRTTLSEEGYRVTAVNSAEQALALLARERFDVVLTDLVMPGMGGIALLSRARDVDPHVVGLVMTGHGSIPTVVEAMNLGAIDYVLKPLKLASLRPAVERALVVRRLRLRNAELEGRVRERTSELEAANQGLEAFCFSISHDLRMPLRAVAGITELLRDYHAHELTPDVRRHVDSIHLGLEEMGQLIDALLAFSRFSRQALVRQPIDVGRLAREVFAELAGERRGRQVELRVGSMPEAKADSALLRQVIMNLLSNAIKYTRPRPEAVIEIGARVERTDPNPVYYVRDNGVGFDAARAERPFEVFQRFHHERDFEGTGVGLAVVRRVVERHGGRVWVESSPGAGATFFFTLPSTPD